MSNICSFTPIRLSEKAINDRFRLIQHNLCYAVSGVQQSNTAFVTVTQFGAKGDGTTDDTVALQAALSSGNSVLYFPPGTYNITSSLLINSNTTLIGYGATIKRMAAIDNMMRNNADGVTGLYDANENIKIFGLKIDGNSATYTTTSTLVAFGHAKDIVIKDCEIYNIPIFHGIELNAVERAIVENCYLHNGTGQELLQLDLMAGFSVFPWFGPYDFTPCRDIIVNGCHFYDAKGGIGSHSGNDPNQHYNIIWSNNTFRNMTSPGHAMGAYNYRNLTIIGNVVDGCIFGISAFKTGAVGLTDWVISGNSFINATGFGRFITLFELKNITITGNTTETSTDSGIFLQGIDGFIVSNNTIRNASTSISSDVPAIDIVGCSNGNISNNIALKSASGFVGSNTIRITTASGYTTNNNITIEGNTCTTPISQSTFNIVGTATKIIVGTNIMNGVILPFINTKAADYTYTPTDKVINVDTTAGNVTITINPTIFNKLGLTIRKTSADANTVIITPSSGTINGGASITLTAQNQVALITSDWTNLDAAILT